MSRSSEEKRPRHGIRRAGTRLSAALPLLVLAGCAGKEMTVEIHGAVMYEKPQIARVSHTVADQRAGGGGLVVTITVLGDPGLRATFDISPEIAARVPLEEIEAGRYEGRFSFPNDQTGGPFTIIGRLLHERAGEVTLRDPDPITITLLDRD